MLFLKVKVFVLFLVFLLPTLVLAENVKTSPLVWQGSNGLFKAILTQDGIFVMYLNEPVDLQLFNPQKISEKDGEHLFLRYDSSLNKYTELILGQDSFKINGSLTMNIQKKGVITIDNDNAYLSIVDSSDTTQPPNILGFLGLTNVINNSGQAAVTLLQGNQFNDIKSIQPYEISGGDLFLKNQPYSNASIGLLLESKKNNCTKGDVAILKSSQLLSIASIKDAKEKARLLNQLIRKAQDENILDQLVKLRVLADSLLVFDPAEEEIALIRYRPTESEKLGTRVKICVMEALKLS